MRVVLDTNVIVSALIWGGSPFELLRVAIDGNIELFSSPILLEELSEVLTRDHLADKLRQQQTSVEEAVRLYGELIIPITPLTTHRIVPTDSDDDHVMAVALAANVDLIVSGDNDLLVLHPWEKIHILKATEALQFINEK